MQPTRQQYRAQGGAPVRHERHRPALYRLVQAQAQTYIAALPRQRSSTSTGDSARDTQTNIDRPAARCPADST